MSAEVMAAHGNLPVSIGSAPGALPPLDEVKQYEKILRISDEIFSGAHPRLKVPLQFVRKIPSRTHQTPIPATGSTEFPQNLQSKPQPSGPSPLKSAATQASPATLNSYSIVPSAGTSSRVAPKPASEIDPIFLTKSDDLVRAEIQLQRQRVERVLREQIEQRRLEARKASCAEAQPDFDVTDVLNKALEMVKPLPPTDAHGANGTAIPSDSFDENSFYSSRAPDSPQEEPVSSESERHTHPQETHGTLPAEVPVGRHPFESSRREAARAGAIGTDTHAPYNPTNKPTFFQSQKKSCSMTHADSYGFPRMPEEPLDEPEYSPPEPDVPAVDRRAHHEYHHHAISNPRRRAHGRPVVSNGIEQPSFSPASEVRIVRNHITSPAAPQPSRVSPLAMAKIPSIHHSRSAQQQEYRQECAPTDPYSGRTSPEPPVPQLMARKRRRLQEPRDLLRRQPADSSEPYIKQEPISPPPFRDIPPASADRSRQPQERPIYIDIVSPRYTPTTDRREAISREPLYELDRYGSSPREFDAPLETRSVSRVSTRRPMRDTQDLRRVASLHHARHPDMLSREYGDPVGANHPRVVRASSYAVAERPGQQERARYYDEIVPSYSRRYAPVEELPPSPGYQDIYVDEDAMPQRRIVVDEHGNQYYETVSASKTRAMPPPPSRLTKVDDYNDRAHVRNTSVHGTSIVEDPYSDRRYAHEMPPPQATYRRVVDYPRGVAEERRPYPRPLADRESILRSGSVMMDYTPRHPTYLEGHEMPRERLVRVSSARPPVNRFDEPREAIHRVPSVRPGGRDVSIYMDEDARPPREYVERPVYASVRPAREERYYEDEDTGRMVLDGTGEVIHRVSQRY